MFDRANAFDRHILKGERGLIYIAELSSYYLLFLKKFSSGWKIEMSGCFVLF